MTSQRSSHVVWVSILRWIGLINVSLSRRKPTKKSILDWQTGFDRRAVKETNRPEDLVSNGCAEKSLLLLDNWGPLAVSIDVHM